MQKCYTFQGGTSIHLLHGGYRFSEDLDFAGKALDLILAKQLVAKSRSDIEKNIIQLLGEGRCEWRFPRGTGKSRIYPYWLNFRPHGKRMKYRVKMEFAHYPVYNSKPFPVKSDLDVMQHRPLVSGTMPEELMAEKITAAMGRAYFKGRDLFDLWYLSEVFGVSINMSLVTKKFIDYHVLWSKSKIEKRLHELKSQNLSAEMNRFLPQRYRQQLYKGNYKIIRQAAMRVIEEVKDFVLSKGKRR